jgi:hypothetical protein
MMYKYLLENLRSYISVLLLSITSVLVLFILESHTGFSLLDEGYLWYGAQRVMVGEVPIRDFMSYDIGRYYWSAAFMSLLGSNGIVALRAAIAVFQVIALFIGLKVLMRSAPKQYFLFWVLAAITLLTWMSPQFRIYDIAIPIIMVSALSFLVEHPSNCRYFLMGLVVGLVAIFGRNHGLYGALASLGVMAYLTIKQENGLRWRNTFASWLSGVVVGYLPMLVFLVFVSGFAQAFWESIRVLFELKGTNFPLPIPWPWLVSFSQWTAIEILRGVAMGVFFIIIATFGMLGIAWLIWAKVKNKHVSPTLIAAIFFALPYAHLAFSRADLAHLAPSISPFLIGAVILLAAQPTKIKWFLVVLLCGASLLVVLPSHSAWYCYSTQKCIETNVAGEKLKVDQRMANNLAMLTKLADRYAPGDRTFIVAPSWPGAYAALGRKSPMWAIYLVLTPPSVALQQAEIERIKAANPGFVVIYDATIDGREETRFRNTHPLVEKYIRDNFEPLGESMHTPFQVYRGKAIKQATQ